MNVSGLSNVMQRINAIEQRFGSKPAAGNFSAVLKSAVEKSGGRTVAGKTSVRDNGDVANMVYQTAQQYGVDPKLAMAVAETESGLQPGAVSSAGAVGVMQLMPETAQGLGVSDSYDARQNIDGGVRYLRQMLTTFGGDVSKAIAAYNAGPQAVKDYNGVPPYAETQNYVDHVLSLYRS